MWELLFRLTDSGKLKGPDCIPYGGSQDLLQILKRKAKKSLDAVFHDPVGDMDRTVGADDSTCQDL